MNYSRWTQLSAREWQHPDYGRLHYEEKSTKIGSIKYHLKINNELIDTFLTKTCLDREMSKYRRTHR